MAPRFWSDTTHDLLLTTCSHFCPRRGRLSCYQFIQKSALGHAVHCAMRLVAKQRLAAARVGTCTRRPLYFVRPCFT